MKAKHGVAVIALFIVALGTMGQLSSNAPFFREARIGKAEIDSDGDISTPGTISAGSFSAPASGATNLNAGVNDTTAGTVSVFGDAGTGGGTLAIYNGATADGTIEYWDWLAHTDGTLKMRRTAPGPTTSDWLTVSTAGDVTMYGDTIISATDASKIFGLRGGAGTLNIISQGNVIIRPDSNNDETTSIFGITPNAESGGSAVFSVTQVGNVSASGTLAATNTITAANASGSAIIDAQGVSGQIRMLRLSTGTSRRWEVRADNTAETGSNSGSIFRITAYDDSAAVIGDVLNVARAAGSTLQILRPFLLVENSTFGNASTDTYTMVGRFIPRDVNDADMVNVPGTTGEIVRNTADTPDSLWYCTAGDVSNATWAEIDTTGAGGGGNAYWGAATSGSPGTTLSVADDSVVVFDGLGSINNTVTTLSNGVAGQTVTFFNDDDTYDIVLNTGGNILTSTTIVGNNSPSKWVTYVYDGTNWRKLANN